jgi:hypothetical protein
MQPSRALTTLEIVSAGYGDDREGVAEAAEEHNQCDVRASGGRPGGLADGRTAERWLPAAQGGRQGGRAPSVEKAVCLS